MVDSVCLSEMGKQHAKMRPEAEAEIRRSRTDFEAQMVEINKRFDQIHSSVGENVNKIAKVGLGLAERFAGLPPGAVSDWVKDKVNDSAATVRTEVKDGMNKVEGEIEKEHP